MHTPGDNSFADLAHHIVLPALVLSLGFAAPILRYTRASMLDTLSLEFMVTARAKGLSKSAVVLRHGFRNALLPLISAITLAIPEVIGGAVITETIFGWPGMGQLVVTAAGNRDVSVVLGIVLLVAVVVTIANLIGDVAYTMADPRVRLE
jgi:peptide/nickel transport system permease protein